MLTPKDRINLELIKKIMSEKRITLPSLRDQDWKKENVETEKVNKLLLNVPTGNITEQNKLIYAGAKLVCDKIGFPQGNSSTNTKRRWKIRLEGRIKKLRQAKVQSETKIKICLNEKTKTKQQTSLKVRLETISQKIFAIERSPKRYQKCQEITNQTEPLKIKKENSTNKSVENARGQTNN